MLDSRIRTHYTHPRPGERAPPVDRREVHVEHALSALAIVLTRERRDALRAVARLPDNLADATAEVRELVDTVLRGAVGGATLDTLPLVESMATRLWGQLEPFSALAQLEPFMAPGALKTKLAVVAQSIITAETGQAEYKALAALELDPAVLTPRKATGLVAITREMLELALVDGAAQLNDLLLRALALGVDTIFLDAITPAPTGNSSGSPLGDVQTLLGVVDRHAGEYLALVTTPAVLGQLATARDADEAPLFPTVTPSGGTLAGLPLIPSSAVPTSSSGSRLLLVDAAMLARALAPPRFSISQQASIRMADDQGTTGAQNLTSLWQTNTAAALIERSLAVAPLRETAVAMLEQVDYSGIGA